MKTLKLLVTFIFFGIMVAYSLPSLNGLNGDYRIISASCDKPYSIRFSIMVNDFARENIYNRFIRIDNAQVDSLLDVAYMADITTGFAISFSKYVEFNISGKFMGDYLTTQKQSYRPDSTNYLSKGFGDTEIGMKFSTGDLFGDAPVKIAFNPWVVIKTGTPYDTAISDSGNLFDENYLGNKGGIFRYFTDNGTDIGGKILLSVIQKSGNVTSNFNINGGYLGHLYNKPNGTLIVNQNSDYYLYGAGVDIKVPGFASYFEFTGKYFRSGAVTPQNINYLTVGFNLGDASTVALNTVFDYRLSSNADTLMNLGANTNYYITQGWGAAPQWRVSLGFVYAYGQETTATVVKKEISTITGKIYDKETGEPLSGRIYFPESDLDTVTIDTNGVYHVDVPPGPIRIHAQVNGYRWMEKSIIAVANKINIVDFPLSKKLSAKGYVSGKVTDAKTGDPVKAIVSFPEIKNSNPVETDEDGIFRVQLPAGNYTIRVDAAGYKPQVEPLVIEARKAKIVNFELIAAEGAIKLTGKVYDRSNSQGVGANIVFEKDGKQYKSVSDASSGIYMIKLMPGVYKVTISADGYIPKTIPFIVPKTGPMIRNFELLKKKAHFILQGIYFDSGSARIRPSSYPILDKVVKTLEEYPDITVEIQGHTDSVGSAENNLRLSFARANAVKAYLVQMGISPSRLIARGYGESMPIAPNTTRAGRARNRRIEFVVIK